MLSREQKNPYHKTGENFFNQLKFVAHFQGLARTNRKLNLSGMLEKELNT
jgi:hypothetical protein